MILPHDYIEQNSRTFLALTRANGGDDDQGRVTLKELSRMEMNEFLGRLPAM
jgi:hypothetical protein